jgi:hypothetical protein
MSLETRPLQELFGVEIARGVRPRPTPSRSRSARLEATMRPDRADLAISPARESDTAWRRAQRAPV